MATVASNFHATHGNYDHAFNAVQGAYADTRRAWVRGAIFSDLGHGSRSNRETMIRRLAEPARNVRRAIENLLALQRETDGVFTLADLLQQMRSADQETVVRAVKHVYAVSKHDGSIACKEMIDELLRVTRSDDPSLVRDAAGALSNISAHPNGGRAAQSAAASEAETARINALLKTPPMRFHNQPDPVDEDELEGREQDSNVAPDEMARVSFPMKKPLTAEELQKWRPKMGKRIISEKQERQLADYEAAKQKKERREEEEEEGEAEGEEDGLFTSTFDRRPPSMEAMLARDRQNKAERAAEFKSMGKTGKEKVMGDLPPLNFVIPPRHETSSSSECSEAESDKENDESMGVVEKEKDESTPVANQRSLGMTGPSSSANSSVPASTPPARPGLSVRDANVLPTRRTGIPVATGGSARKSAASESLQQRKKAQEEEKKEEGEEDEDPIAKLRKLRDEGRAEVLAIRERKRKDDEEGAGDQSMLRRSTRKAVVTANEVLKTPSKSSTRGKQ